MIEMYMKKIFANSDIHGDYKRYRELLIEHKVINETNDWIAGDSILICNGDITDRGRKGIDVIKLLMQLEKQSQSEGGNTSRRLNVGSSGLLRFKQS